MSAVAAPSRSTPITSSHRPARVALILARVEGRRLIRRPIFLAGLAMSIAVILILTWSKAPVMHRDDVFLTASLFPLAVATYLAANLAGSRSRRNATEELYDTAPAPALRRTTGHLLSLAWPLAVAILLVVADIVYLKASGGVWSPSPQEIATGPMIVLIFGATGVLVSRVAPSVVAGPVGLIGLGAVQLVLMRYQDPRLIARRWGAFWINIDEFVPRETIFRPAGWHLLYLGGIAALVIAATRLRHGPGAGRVLTGAAAVTLIVLGVWGQSRPLGLERRVDDKRVAREQVVCHTRDGVRSCAYRAYAPWITRWQTIVGSVFESIPIAVRPGFTVRQSIVPPYEEPTPIDTSAEPGDPLPEVAGESTPSVVETGTHWGIRFEAGVANLSLATRAAAWAVGLPAGDQPVIVRWTAKSIAEYTKSQPGGVLPAGHEILKPGNVRYQGTCSTLGEARAIVALWIAARSSESATNAMLWLTGLYTYGIHVYGDPGGASSMDFGQPNFYLNDFEFSSRQNVEWGVAEAHYVAQLLRRDSADVRRTIEANWAALTRPGARTEDAIKIFGLKRLPTIEEQLRAAHIKPEEAIRMMFGGGEPAKVEATLEQGLAALQPRTPAARCP